MKTTEIKLSAAGMLAPIGDEDEGRVEVVNKYLGTQDDRLDMDRLGKVQKLRRNFRFLSIVGFSAVLGSTWEWALVVAGISTVNGGPAGAIWLFLIVCFGMFFVTLSMAEMALMAPTSGGQYHWVSEFAPKKFQKIASYVVGWLCVLGWQGAMASSMFAAAQQFEALIALNIPTYSIHGWHGTLLSIAIALLAIVFNTVLVRKLRIFEGIALVLHGFGFIAFMVVLWLLSPRSDVGQTWTDFQDNTGWGNPGLATLVGILGPIVTLVGGDSVCHLSEELRDASWVLPRSVVVSAIVNYGLGFIMTVTIMMTRGDLETVMETNTGQVYVQVVINATRSRVGTSILTAAVAVLLVFCSSNSVTTASRQLFAFSRDKGLPFSKWISTVSVPFAPG
ncbi:Uu.00g012150.m01.CDS01 [Anthostomella pinea]|uniref:Uu.00g012150.m01.CDS01 n=1 Tax=Anthostomella pinea TaxID=933095 RepID=A0AAI8VXW2_9PEZI|nr:Uu.00g012150.m01.CDS01 [Anthostomella pinea]